MAPIIRIALVQFQPKPLALEANYAYCAAEIRAAAAAGAQLAVLPEYHLTAWCPEQPGFVAACAASGAFLARYQALARETGISIVPGTLVETHRTRGGGGGGGEDGATLVTELPAGGAGDEPLELRNMAYFLAGGSGAVLGRYQKTNLWHSERPHLTAAAATAASSGGNSGGAGTVAWSPHTAFDTPWQIEEEVDDGDGGGADANGSKTSRTTKTRPLRAGLLVCWDVAFPEAFRALVADGADLIVVPSYWETVLADDGHDAADDAAAAAVTAVNPASEAVFLRATLVARACENSVAVAYCNTGGLSMLAAPLVGSQGELAPGTTATQLVDMDPAVQRTAERWYKVRADMGRPDWHYAHAQPVPGAVAGGGAK